MYMNQFKGIEPIRTVKDWIKVSGLDLNDYSSFIKVYQELSSSCDTSLVSYNVNEKQFVDTLQIRVDLVGNIWCNRRGFTSALLSDRYVIPPTEELERMKLILPEFVEKIVGMKIKFTVDDILDGFKRESVDELSHKLLSQMRIKICAREISLNANPSRNKTSILSLMSKQSNKMDIALKFLRYGTVEKYEEYLIKKIMDQLGNANRNNVAQKVQSLKDDFNILCTISNCTLRNNFENDTSCFYRYFADDVKDDCFYKQFNIIDENGINPACAFKAKNGGQTVSGAFTYYKSKK